MANLGTTFDPEQIPEDERSFDVLPAGTYEAQVIESEIADTKRGDGKMLNVTWEITAGPFEHRKVWDRINIQNPSAEAQRIGQRRLADMCEAMGTGAIKDSEELHFKPCLVVLGIEKDKSGEYPDKNRVTRVKPLGSGSAPAARPTSPAPHVGRQAQPQTAAASAAPAQTGSGRPWGQKRA